MSDQIEPEGPRRAFALALIDATWDGGPHPTSQEALAIVDALTAQGYGLIPDQSDELRRVLSKVDTAAAWLEALGDPVPLMRKSHAILRELAPEPVEASRGSEATHE